MSKVEDGHSKPTWTEITAPIVKRCEVAAAFNSQAVWPAEGAAALGKLIKEMARKLDTAARNGASQ